MHSWYLTFMIFYFIIVFFSTMVMVTKITKVATNCRHNERIIKILLYAVLKEM